MVERMRHIFLLKMVTSEGFGYYNGKDNFSAFLNEAQKYSDYNSAEFDLRTLFENGVCGYIQIEKYFMPV